jgi:hypothetical protein
VFGTIATNVNLTSHSSTTAGQTIINTTKIHDQMGTTINLAGNRQYSQENLGQLCIGGTGKPSRVSVT